MKCLHASASEALELMERALKILDESDMPGEIGAHLDLAVERLRDHIDRPRDLLPRPWSTPLN